MLILLATPISAGLPIMDSYLVTAGDGFFTILNTQSLIFEKSKAINFTFVVTDYYNSLSLDNSSINCTFRAVNSQGVVLSYGNVSYNLTNDLWYYPLTSSQLSQIGSYDWTIYCFNSTHGGSSSFIFTVTESGQNETQVDVGSAIYFLFIIFMFIMLAVVNKFPYFKWGSLVYAFYQSMLFMGFVYASYKGLNTNWIFTTNLYFTLLVGFMLLILSIMFRSIDLMTHSEEAQHSQLGMDKFEGDKFDKEGRI